MQVSDLFSAAMEPALNEWIRQFKSPADLFAGMPQLYAKLESQDIEGAGSVVRSLAIIRGPAIVGRDTVVGSHAEVQPGSFIGSKCMVGHGCSIVNSMVMNNVVIWPATFVGNSVIGFQSIIGSGAALGVARPEMLNRTVCTSTGFGVFLGDHSVVGANSSLKPGTIVGQRTIIGEGVLVDGIYGPDQIVSATQNVQVTPRRS